MRLSILCAAALVCAASASAPVAAKSEFKTAGVFPIAESQVPANANPAADTCSAARGNSCDNCDTPSQYCDFRPTGDVRCCTLASKSVSDEDESTNGAQIWNAMHSFLGGFFGQKQESADKAAGSITPLTSEAEAESGAVGVSKEEALPESGAVGVIKSEALPESGAVGVIQTEAEPESGAVGVVKDEPLPESGAVGVVKDEPLPESGAVSPIKENPIPAGASESDSCSMKRSCDVCSAEQYCRYSLKGKASCCTMNAQANKGAADASVMPTASRGSVGVIREAALPESGAVGVSATEAEPESGSVGVVKDEPLPESAKVSPITEDDELPESAKISPITENPIPSWASPSDVCLLKSSCDECAATSYCRYTKTGAAQCCGRMIAMQ